MPADIELSKTQIKRIIMSGDALGRILGRLLPKLIEPATSVLKKCFSTFRLSAAMSGIDGAIKKKYMEQVQL